MSRVSGRQFVEDSEGEEYLHKVAWVVVDRQLRYGDSNRIGAHYDYMVAMMLAFHCMEGYLNFVGDKIAPDLWRDEKASFKGTGITKKLEIICDRCGLDRPNKGRRPYSTLTNLKKLRDDMAHPITQKTKASRQFTEGKTSPLFPKTYLSVAVSHERALRAREDIKDIADEIHRAAVVRYPHAGLGTDALEGIHSMHSATTRVVP